jgi:peptide methionine sulfoxide reductase msrA/msrB
MTSNEHTIYLAGGCFWGLQRYLKRIGGVLKTRVGYAQGSAEAPSYEQVCLGTTGHAETVEVAFDDVTLPLVVLLQMYYEAIDPTSVNRQGFDTGEQYRTGIYYVCDGDLPCIEASLTKLQERYDKPLAIEVSKLRSFYEAEAYHQDYLDKDPSGYCHISLAKIAQAPDRARELAANAADML